METAETNNRQPISVSLPPDVIKWLDDKVQSRVYASRSHGVELLVRQASMREQSTGSGATTPASFHVEKEIHISPVDVNDAALFANLKDSFSRALEEASLKHLSPHLIAITINGQRRLFYTLKKVGETMKADMTVQSYVAISQDVTPVQLTLTMTRDPMGLPGKLEGAETPISKAEFEKLGLNSQQVFQLIDRISKGIDLY